MVSSALLAAEDPLKADSERNNVSKTISEISEKILYLVTKINFIFFIGFKKIRPFLHGSFHS